MANTHRNALQDKPDLLEMHNYVFWVRLEEAELLIRPFCDASFLMQREANSMADVVLMLLNLYRHVREYCGDSEDAKELLLDIENRWKKEENPLFFLAFALHPAYRRVTSLLLEQSLNDHGNWKKCRNYFSVSRLRVSAQFYFGKFELLDQSRASAEETSSILNELDDDLQKWLKNLPLDLVPYMEGSDPVDWWMRQIDEFPAIATLAIFLLDAPVQSASCERLFKEFSRLHTKARNRLHPQTTHMMALVKYDVKRRYQEEDPGFNSKKTGSTNRFISPLEHRRTDTPLSPPARNVLPVGDNSDSQNEDKAARIEDGSDYEHEESSDEEEEELLSDAEEGNLLTRWNMMLEAALPDEFNDIQQEDDQSSDEETVHGTNPCSEISCFETRWPHLPPLPELNDPKYPQEDSK